MFPAKRQTALQCQNKRDRGARRSNNVSEGKKTTREVAPRLSDTRATTAMKTPRTKERKPNFMYMPDANTWYSGQLQQRTTDDQTANENKTSGAGIDEMCLT